MRTGSWLALGAAVVAAASMVAAGPLISRPTEASPELGALRDSVASLQRQMSALRVVAGLPDNAGQEAQDLSADVLIRQVNEMADGVREVSDKLGDDADKVARTPSIMPTAGWLTSQFTASRFHPLLHQWLPHLGIDVAAPYGTPVIAPAAGTVVRVGPAAGYGLVVEIDHGNGIVTKYGHLSRALVREGQPVIRGQSIARVGNSGLSTGPHLHYEVLVNGEVVDPLTYVLPPAIPG